MAIRYGITPAAARVNKGLTQNEAANKIGVCKKTLIAYEKGKRVPSIEVLNKMSDIYGWPVDGFLILPSTTLKANLPTTI